MFGFYMLNYARGDTDNVGTFPADSYNLHSEWGPTSFDVRHRVFVGGSLTLLQKITLSPFITASSGAPFNIISGFDTNGDGIFNDRPAYADAATPGVVDTPWGIFNPKPTTGEQIISRNSGRGPGQFSVNLRLARTWGFGRRTETATGGGMSGQMAGPRYGGPPGGGMRGGGRGFGGPGGMFGDASSGRRFSLTLGLTARNVFNFVNLAPPVGNLSSLFFGESTALAGGFGPSSGSSNRRIDLQLRLNF